MEEDRIILDDTLGRFPVQYTDVVLKDTSRLGWNGESDRKLMVSVFCPVGTIFRKDRRDYLPRETLRYTQNYFNESGLPENLQLRQLTMQFACGTPGKWLPVLIFTPGFRGSRHLYKLHARDLASQGYLVITIDHPGETAIVEFSPEDVVYGLQTDMVDDDIPGKAELMKKVLEFRTADIRFVIDQLLLQTPLNTLSMKESVNPSKIFVFGHSLGGATALEVTHQDKRISGCLNFDGRLKGAVAAKEASLDRPFFFVGTSKEKTLDAGELCKRSTGPGLVLHMQNMTHVSFSDVPYLFTRLGDLPQGITDKLSAIFGPLGGQRMRLLQFTITRAAVQLAFDGERSPITTFLRMTSEADVTAQKGLQ